MTLTHTYSVSLRRWPLSNVDVSNFIHRPVLLVLLFQHVHRLSRMSGSKVKAQLNISGFSVSLMTSPPFTQSGAWDRFMKTKISQHQRHTPITALRRQCLPLSSMLISNSRDCTVPCRLFEHAAIHYEGVLKVCLIIVYKALHSELQHVQESARHCTVLEFEINMLERGRHCLLRCSMGVCVDVD